MLRKQSARESDRTGRKCLIEAVKSIRGLIRMLGAGKLAKGIWPRLAASAEGIHRELCRK